MATLIAEDLLLLLLDDASGKLTATAYPQTVLGGALLIELALTGAVEIEEKSGVWKTAKVHPAPDAAPQDDVLRAGYDLLAEKERGAQDLVDRLGKRLKDQLADRLAARRRALTATLVSGAEPDQRTAALVAILSAIDKAHKVVDHQGMSSRDVRKRAKQISEGAWAAEAVRDAITASVAAIGAVAAGAAVASSGS
ncbi:hypothetical protein GCM10023350_14720 [Nocardioides endophyticus]|uniref:GPP34 family phosphoprotein n=1 Tax=Nocardioides endophyticus TaxID=1353775 RepID=A0ABP8YLI8_9ACTN